MPSSLPHSPGLLPGPPGAEGNAFHQDLNRQGVFDPSGVDFTGGSTQNEDMDGGTVEKGGLCHGAGGFAPTRVASARGKRCLCGVNQRGQLGDAGQKWFCLPGEGRRAGPQKAVSSEMSLLPSHSARSLSADSTSFQRPRRDS